MAWFFIVLLSKLMIMEQQKANPNNAVVWFEIYVDDLTRARKFYETVFGVKLEEIGDPTGSGISMLTFPMKIERPNASGALVHMEGFKPGGNSTIVYFDSLDCATEEGRVAAAGGKIFKAKMPIGEHGFMSLCTDTEGNMFGIHSMK